MKFDINAIHTAWQRVKAKGKSGGIDGQSLSDFEARLKTNLKSLLAEMNDGSYSPEPPLRVDIPKDQPHETRPVGLMTIRDKIAQQAVKMQMEPAAEKIFSPFSYAYRPQKGHGKAITAISAQIKRGYVHIISCDIDNFFDSIDHKVLTDCLKSVYDDDYLLHLLECWMKIGAFRDGVYLNQLTGIHQGGVLSPLLSNLYLTPFDRFMVREFPALRYIRYADNFMLLSRDKEPAEPWLSKLRSFLTERLKLALNPVSAETASVEDGFDFCGIHFQLVRGKLTRTISPKKFRKAMEHIESVCRKYGKDPAKFVTKINQMISGWERYYFPYDTFDQIRQLETAIEKKIIEFGMAERAENKRIIDQISWLTKNEKIAKSKPEPKGHSVVNQISPAVETAPPPKHAGVRHKILMKRKKYQKIYIRRYDLVLNKPGMYLGKKESSLVIRYQNRELQSSPVAALKRIALQSLGCSISTDALFTCAEHNIRLELVQWDGKPAAILQPPQSEDWKISARQVQSSGEPVARNVACRIIGAKIRNQAALLKYFMKNKTARDEALLARCNEELRRMEEYLGAIEKLDRTLSMEELSGKIFGYEGLAAGSYWAVIALLIPGSYGFKGRVRKGAQDIVNVCLNYGYGILYTRVWAAVMQARLNPQVSFFHLYQKEKPALVYDLIEPFRQPAVDRTVIGMITKKEIPSVTALKDGRLDDDIRRKLAMKIMIRLESPFIYRDKETTLNDQIYLACQELADVLMGKKKTYKPFLMKW